MHQSAEILREKDAIFDEFAELAKTDDTAIDRFPDGRILHGELIFRQALEIERKTGDDSLVRISEGYHRAFLRWRGGFQLIEGGKGRQQEQQA